MVPAPGETWKHWKGGVLYTIVTLARVEVDLTPVVIYKSHADGQTWVRPLAEFLEAVEYERDGRKMIPRFEKVE